MLEVKYFFKLRVFILKIFYLHFSDLNKHLKLLGLNFLTPV